MDKKMLLVESGGVLHKPALCEEEETKGKWTATVWKLGERNLNGRTYPRELGERLARENQSTMAYDGHEVDWITGQEYGIAKAVCSNPRVEGNELKVDIDFVDENYESLLEKLSEKGIPIGVSSVGYGDVDPVNGVVKAESYVLVRFLDFVTMPAGEVYMKMGEKARTQRQRRSAEPLGKAEADEAMAERRSKVAEGLAKLIVRRKA